MTTDPQILLDDLLETVSLINPGTEPGKLKQIMGTAARIWLSIHGDRCGLDFFPFAVGYVTALAGVDESFGNDLNKIAALRMTTKDTKASSEEGKSPPPSRPGLAWDDPLNLVIETIVKGHLRKLTDAQRVRFIEEACGEFCHHCGRIREDGRHCKCQNDD